MNKLLKLCAPIIVLSILLIPTSFVFAASTFTQSFGVGATDKLTGGEVTRLQQLLARDSSIYPEAIISGYFGKLTEKALQRWQAKKGIVSSGNADRTGYGWVGRRTRAALNEGGATYNTVSTISPTSGTGGLSVSASAGIKSPSNLAIKTTYTNSLKSSFVGTGNGQKVVFTQTSPNKLITLPATLSCVTPCQIENKVAIAPGVPAGEYSIKVSAVAGKDSATTNFKVVIGDPVPFDFTLSASSQISATKSLTGNSTGRNEIVVRTVSGEVAPVTLTQTTNIPGLILKNELGKCTAPCSVANAVTMAPDLLTGNYTITVTGVAGNVRRSVTYNVVLSTGGEFGFHISNQADPDKSITMTRPATYSSTSLVPIKFVLDGGSPRLVRVTMSRLPEFMSASISPCYIPCEQNLSITLNPEILVGTKTVTFTVEADYIDLETGLPKIMKKTYSQKVVVVNGDQLQ